MKSYTLNLNYQEKKRGLTVDVTRTATMNCGDSGFELKEIATFLDDVRKIYKDVKRLSKTAHHIEVELSVAEYRIHGIDGHRHSTQENFDFWKYYGSAEEDGIHLEADERYTEPSHDMWLDFGKFDPLNDITA